MIHSAASGAAAFGLFVAVALPAGALENAAARLASAALPPGGACSGALGMSGGGGATKPVGRAIAGKAGPMYLFGCNRCRDGIVIWRIRFLSRGTESLRQMHSKTRPLSPT